METSLFTRLVQEYLSDEQFQKRQKGKMVLPGLANNHHHPQGSIEEIAHEMFDLPAIRGYTVSRTFRTVIS